MKRRTFIQSSALASISSVAFAPAARAQAWPAKPVTLVYAYPPGGGADPLARVLAQELKGRLGQAVVVENRSGAAGTIGTGSVAKAAPDGYTFLVNVSQELAIAPWLYPQLPYVVEKNFTAVCRCATLPMMLVAHPGANIRSVAELVARAKAAPGSVSYASAGSGSLQHLATEVLQRRTGIQLNHIPYKGVAEATRDLLGGQVPLGFVGVSTAISHVKEGKLVVLGISTESPLPDMPQFSPLAANAELAGFDLPQWFGIVAPAGTPAPIVEKLAADVRAILQTDSVKSFLQANGLTPAYMGPAPYQQFIFDQKQLFGRVIREGNIRI